MKAFCFLALRGWKLKPFVAMPLITDLVVISIQTEFISITASSLSIVERLVVRSHAPRILCLNIRCKGQPAYKGHYLCLGVVAGNAPIVPPPCQLPLHPVIMGTVSGVGNSMIWITEVVFHRCRVPRGLDVTRKVTNVRMVTGSMVSMFSETSK